MTTPKLVAVTDLTATERHVVCEVSSLGPLLAGWWSELGLSTAVMGSHARNLITAVRAGDWATAHRIAEHVSIDVSAAGPGTPTWSAGDDWAVM